jgi:hypothetical protein
MFAEMPLDNRRVNKFAGLAATSWLSWAAFSIATIDAT